MRRFSLFMWVLSLLVWLGGAPGCVEPEVVADQASSVCPTCKQQTKAMPLYGLERESHVCPECRTNVAGLEDLPYHKVQYCERCQKIVGDCPQCLDASR